jgi:hypothetical protein
MQFVATKKPDQQSCVTVRTRQLVIMLDISFRPTGRSNKDELAAGAATRRLLNICSVLAGFLKNDRAATGRAITQFYFRCSCLLFNRGTKNFRPAMNWITLSPGCVVYLRVAFLSASYLNLGFVQK